jgi:hypothetical protein
MRRLSAGAALAAVLLAPSGALASHGDAGSGDRDFAVGGGSNQFLIAVGDARFAFAATSDPFGDDPKGYVSAPQGDPDGLGPLAPFTAGGDVTCLRVAGNRAAFKWRFRRSTGSAEPFEGGGVQAFVEDNGQPREGEPVDGTALDPPQPAGVFDLAADRCDDPALRSYDRIESGNVTVHDAVLGAP